MSESEPNLHESQPSPQALISSIVATLLLLGAWKIAGKQIPGWGQIIKEEHGIWPIIAPVFTLLLAVSGWLYVFTRKKLFGITHAILMCAMALAGFYFGILPLVAHNYPTESLVALFLMAYAAIGIIAFICVIGMVIDLRRAGE